MGPWLILILLLVAADAASAASDSIPGGGMQPIFVAPAVRWDSAMLTNRPASKQTATDFSTLTGGLRFGISPAALNAGMAKPTPGLAWKTLVLANEYLDEVRFYALPLEAAGTLRMGVTACTGEHSSLVLLFRASGLFRLSYRLVADRSCPDTSEAARQVLVRYVPIQPTVALSVRYQTGRTEVVDVTDPASGALIPVRWRQGRL